MAERERASQQRSVCTLWGPLRKAKRNRRRLWLCSDKSSYDGHYITLDGGMLAGPIQTASWPSS